MNGMAGGGTSIDQGLTRGDRIFVYHILMPLSKSLLAPPNFSD